MLPDAVFEENFFDMAAWLKMCEDNKKDIVAKMMEDPVKWCTKPGYKLNPATRTYKDWRFRCKCKDDEVCPSCARQYRLDKLEILYDTLIHFRANKFIEIKGTEKECAKLRRKYGKERIIRVPQDDGVVMLCVIDTDEEDGIVMSHTDVTAEYVDNLFSTPTGKRITGGYTRTIEEKERDDEYIIVEATVFAADTDPQTLFKLHRETVRRTYDLNPSADTLQECLDKHEAVFSEVAAEWKIELVRIAGMQKTKVYVSEINWHRERLE